MIPMADAEYLALSAIAAREAGLHIPVTKRAFLASRLQRRLRRHGMADFADYLSLITGKGPDAAAERQNLISALTTNVTEIYREPHHFVLLANHLGDWARRARLCDSPVLIWSAGCASGEEPLSIAATCRSVLGPSWRGSVRILATDVDAAVLDVARARSGDEAIVSGLAALRPSIVPSPAPWLPEAKDVVAELQSGITYLRHNLLDPLPVKGEFDMIFCRNVTIYFSQQSQNEVHQTLRGRLAPEGILALGHSERLCAEVTGLVPAGRTAFVRTQSSEAVRAGVAGCR